MGKCAVCNCHCDLLLWKNPLKTGKYFFGSLLVLLILKKVNLITFFLRVLYTVFFISGSIEFLTKAFLGQGLVTKYGVKQCPNTVYYIKPYIDEFLKQLPVKQAKFRKLVFAEVPKNTFKAFLVAYCLHKLFSWFSLWTLLFVVDLSVFTLPLVYTKYQNEIETTLCKLHKCGKDKLNQCLNQVCDQLEPHLKKIGPLNSILQNLKQKHTAAETVEAKETASATSTGVELPKVPETRPAATQEFDVDQLVKETAAAAAAAAASHHTEQREEKQL